MFRKLRWFAFVREKKPDRRFWLPALHQVVRAARRRAGLFERLREPRVHRDELTTAQLGADHAVPGGVTEMISFTLRDQDLQLHELIYRAIGPHLRIASDDATSNKSSHARFHGSFPSSRRSCPPSSSIV